MEEGRDGGMREAEKDAWRGGGREGREEGKG